MPEKSVSCFIPSFLFEKRQKITKRIKTSAKGQRGLIGCPTPDKSCVHLIPLWTALHLRDPQGTQKTCEKGRAVQLTDKKPSLCPVPWTWTLVNTICLNNDQNIIDMMRLPRACPFNSAWLRGKKKEKERMKKPTLTWPWHASLGSDFSKMKFKLESQDLSVLKNKEVGRQTGPPPPLQTKQNNPSGLERAGNYLGAIIRAVDLCDAPFPLLPAAGSGVVLGDGFCTSRSCLTLTRERNRTSGVLGLKFKA